MIDSLRLNVSLQFINCEMHIRTIALLNENLL